MITADSPATIGGDAGIEVAGRETSGGAAFSSSVTVIDRSPSRCRKRWWLPTQGGAGSGERWWARRLLDGKLGTRSCPFVPTVGRVTRRT